MIKMLIIIGLAAVCGVFTVLILLGGASLLTAYGDDD